MTAAARPGKVLTFYSYKGGVGRSMALANIAVLLASKGHKILIVDWDLEAPGIEQYFASYVVERRERKDQREHRTGVVDLMKARSSDTELDWRTCITPTLVRGHEIHILGAGQRDATYAAALSALSWKDLFANHDLGRYLEQLRGEWTAAYDFVLIDSRTGITDIGGICTIHLPDIIIALFTSNEQSLTGVVRAMRDARREQAALPVDRSRLLILPLPSRDESQSEHERSEQWYVRFARDLDEFYRDWLPARLTPAEALDVLRVPYKAYWSFGEPLPVIEEGISRPGSLGYAYALVASLIESGFDWSQMTAGRYAVDRPKSDDAGPSPGRGRSSLPRNLIVALVGLAAIVAVAVGIWSTASPGPDLRPPDPYLGTGAYVGAPPKPEQRTRAALLEAAGRTEVPLHRVLLLREIPAPLFPAAEVKELLKGVVVPEAVFRSDTSDIYADARFDHRGERLVLARRSGAFVVAAGGRGSPVAIPASPPVTLAVFSADDRRVITADGTGMAIWDASTGTATAAVPYFAKNRARFVAVAEGNDGSRTFLLGGPDGSPGTRNVVFAVDPDHPKEPRWWNAPWPLQAIDFHEGRLWAVVPGGAIWAMQRPGPTESRTTFLPPPITAAVLARGHVALANDARVIAAPLATGAPVQRPEQRPEIVIARPAQSNPPNRPAVPAIAVGDKYLAAALGPSVEIAALAKRTVNDSVRLAAGGDAALVATAGDWLLVGSTEGSVEMWRLGNNSYHAVLHRSDELAASKRSPLQRIAFSPDGGRALAIWRDGTVRVWLVRAMGVVDDATDAEVLPRLQRATSACLAVEDRLLLLPSESAAQARAANEACLAAAAASGATSY
jgi:Mrp family chromosome partitioning ATPase